MYKNGIEKCSICLLTIEKVRVGCRFWYQFQHLQTGDGSLNVLQQSQDKQRHTHLFRSDEFGWDYSTDDWTLATVRGTYMNEAFRLVIEAEITRDHGTMMAAVDDISVSDGACEKLGKAICWVSSGWHLLVDILFCYVFDYFIVIHNVLPWFRVRFWRRTLRMVQWSWAQPGSERGFNVDLPAPFGWPWLWPASSAWLDNTDRPHCTSQKRGIHAAERECLPPVSLHFSVSTQHQQFVSSAAPTGPNTIASPVENFRAWKWRGGDLADGSAAHWIRCILDGQSTFFDTVCAIHLHTLLLLSSLLLLEYAVFFECHQLSFRVVANEANATLIPGEAYSVALDDIVHASLSGAPDKCAGK